MSHKRRVFISFVNPELLDSKRIELQQKVIEKIESLGLQPEMFFHKGTAASMAWSLRNVIDIMNSCIGAVVIALPRWNFKNEDGVNYILASEYAQIEGAIATTLKLPLLILAERGIVDRGLTWTGAGHPIIYIPSGADPNWLEQDAFNQRFGFWADQLNERSDLFLGYSSKARNTALAIHLFLTQKLGLTVRNWEMDFAAAGIIIDEIETASKLCSGGIFLFTKDDNTIEGSEIKAAPRDNVVFEAGYFTASKGRKRVLIIKEEGAKMPADLGGNIYLNLIDRNDISPIETAISDFVKKRL
ncbi:TIR domain-containing protein [Algoriphagus sp.]|uniref:TIR domain-containing protein n=1 Tax=Algoriphagus sp. TaxID=1872435 RepID=UPI0025FD7054|nr:TIR domain-containing protein [Algoriphagus sp.]